MSPINQVDYAVVTSSSYHRQHVVNNLDRIAQGPGIDVIGKQTTQASPNNGGAVTVQIPIVVAILGGIAVLATLVTLWLIRARRRAKKQEQTGQIPITDSDSLFIVQRAPRKGIGAIETASSSRSEIMQQELQRQRLSQAVAQIQTLEQQLRTLREENAAQAADISPPSYSPSPGPLL
ncbi:hypothetical protein C8J56DRAFT_889251 [Mycena floridula]|nr:hypothetical protein C8J56DRAFT_889251 [Mycena floridula]